jgi:hypothetical protein
MVITFPRVRTGRRGGGGEGGGQGAEAQAEEVSRQTRALREYLASAKAYADIKARLAGGAPGTQEISLPMEAMVPVIRGESPVILDVETAEQIRGALAIVDSFHLKVIFRGARFAWQIADTIAARRIPVIVGPTVAAPDDRDPYDAIYAYPGVLARAGVKIAFQTDNASDSRNLAFNAGIATAYGLDPDRGAPGHHHQCRADLGRRGPLRQSGGGKGRQRHRHQRRRARCAHRYPLRIYSGTTTEPG